MNRVIKLFTILLAGLLSYACSPEEYKLAGVDVSQSELVEGIAYKIEHDAANPNIVYLTSLMDSKYQPLWDHPQGRSQSNKVTLKMPFPGEYTVTFGVQTRGGSVFGEPVTFTIDEMYADFISDPLWALLTGGVGEEKTWLLDLDADGLSRYFVGPLYFYGTNDSWLSVTDGIAVGGDSWNWSPDWKGNSWMMDAADFGTMTFSLKGSADVTVVHNTISSRGTETGKFSISAEEKTMRLIDASPLHDSNRDGVVIDWGNIRIMSLTETHMQLAVIRDEALSGEGPCLLVYNYISQEYFDNWVPSDLPDPEPPYNGVPNNDLTTSVTTKKKWALSLQTPYNWVGLGGNFLNEWSTPADLDWAPYDEAKIKNISLTLSKVGDTTGEYEFTNDLGDIILGTYLIEEGNFIKFDKAISITIADWATLKTDEFNRLRIISTVTDAFGNIKKIWLGSLDPIKPEYMVYGFEPSALGSTPEPGETNVIFDASKILVGNLESNTNLRIELFNEYGATNSNPDDALKNVTFAEKISVTFTISGIDYKAEATGSNTAKMSYASFDWSFENWGAGPGVVNITGDGTYTVYINATSLVARPTVWVIDIADLATDVEDLSSISVTVNSITVK